MGYEQKYNEALARAKSMYESKDDAELAAYIFPELKESEDERIRRELVQYIKDYPNIPNGQYSRSDFFAYLERQKGIVMHTPRYAPPEQKEQKPAEWSEEDVEKLAKIRASKSGVLTSEMTFYRQGVRDAFNYKGFRPSWKPSEEQVYSLGTVVKGYDNCTVGSVGYNLKELYEQLKKL